MKKMTALILAVLMALTVVSALADSPLYTFQVTEINRGGMVMGRCTAPTGWQVTGNAYVGTTGQSMENPWMLNIIATDNVSGTMAYCSERNFLQILRWGIQLQQNAFLRIKRTEKQHLELFDICTFRGVLPCDTLRKTVQRLKGKKVKR